MAIFKCLTIKKLFLCLLINWTRRVNKIIQYFSSLHLTAGNTRKKVKFFRQLANCLRYCYVTASCLFFRHAPFYLKCHSPYIWKCYSINLILLQLVNLAHAQNKHSKKTRRTSFEQTTYLWPHPSNWRSLNDKIVEYKKS